MSDEQAETWRVVEESGEERIVEVMHVTNQSFPYWEALCHSDRRGGMLSQNSARHAVLELAANHKWNAVEVLAPGQASRAEALAAERERIATMLRDNADELVNDAPEYAEAIYDAEALVRGEWPVYAPPAGNGIVTPEEIAALRRTADGAVMAGEDHADALLAAVVKIEKLQSMLAAARADGAGAMRDAAVAAVRRRAEELDASVTDEEAADDEEGYGRFQEALELVEVLGALPIPEATNTETK